MRTATVTRAILVGVLLLALGCAAGKANSLDDGDTEKTADTADTADTGGADSAETSDTGDTGPSIDTTETADSADTTDTGQVGDTVDTGATADTAPTWATPCASYTTPVQTGTVVDTALDELSGIAVSRRDPDVLWVEEDHGGANAIYAIDAAGDTLATVTLDGATNHDWEDIAVGSCGEETCIYIGEIGNNDGDRTDFGVYRLVEPDLTAVVDGALTTADWVWYGFDYPDTPTHNAEALAITSAGLPVILTKHYDDERSDAYIYPLLDPFSNVTLTSLGTLVTGADGTGGGAALTAADLWPDDSRLIFRTYSNVYELDLSAGVDAIASAPITTLAGAIEMHGEAVAYDPWRGGFWEVSEGVNTGVWFTGCAD